MDDFDFDYYLANNPSIRRYFKTVCPGDPTFRQRIWREWLTSGYHSHHTFRWISKEIIPKGFNHVSFKKTLNPVDHVQDLTRSEMWKIFERDEKSRVLNPKLFFGQEKTVVVITGTAMAGKDTMIQTMWTGTDRTVNFDVWLLAFNKWLPNGKLKSNLLSQFPIHRKWNPGVISDYLIQQRFVGKFIEIWFEIPEDPLGLKSDIVYWSVLKGACLANEDYVKALTDGFDRHGCRVWRTYPVDANNPFRTGIYHGCPKWALTGLLPVQIRGANILKLTTFSEARLLQCGAKLVTTVSSGPNIPNEDYNNRLRFINPIEFEKLVKNKEHSLYNIIICSEISPLIIELKQYLIDDGILVLVLDTNKCNRALVDILKTHFNIIKTLSDISPRHTAYHLGRNSNNHSNDRSTNE